MIRRQLVAVAIALACALVATPASARHHKAKHHHFQHTHVVSVPAALCADNNGRYLHCSDSQASQPMRYSRQSYSDRGAVVSHPSGCPGRAFCGCGVSVKVFGHPIRDLFLASNWRRFPPASPAAGMVAWRSHHVVYIEAIDGNGNATVYDPNSGNHQTRVHQRSLAGFHIVNPHGSRMASR